MKEVTGPVIATALVLCAVFIPSAFITGLTGQFYRQFALTIAISTVISAFNSLTLSPALAAILLKGKDVPKDRLSKLIDRLFGGWLFRPFNRLFQRASAGYVNLATRLLRAGAIVLMLYVGLLGLAYLGLEKTPTGFIPQQDKQYLVAFAQLPEGASLDRTEAVILRMSELALKHPGVANTVSFSGLSINGFVNSASAGLMFIPLESFDERKDPSMSDTAIAQALAAEYGRIQEAFVMVVPPPPVESLGSIGGFRVQIEDRGSLGHEALYQQIQSLVDKARALPELAGVFSSYQVNVPQIDADIDRDKAKAHGVAVVLIVPMTLLSAIAGVLLTGGDNNIFTQISLIVLAGLACKNAILLVEFAREKQQQGLDCVNAVLKACHLRLRPILMTSIAFIMGVVPLVLSSGAGAEMRRAMGIAVLSGMVGVTFFGLLLTPVFYVWLRRLVERRSQRRAAMKKMLWEDKA